MLSLSPVTNPCSAPLGLADSTSGREWRCVTPAQAAPASAQPSAHLDEYPFRLEYGTPNTIGIAGLNAGLKWVLAKGLSSIHEHEMELTQMLRDGLAAIPRIILYCQKDLTNHIAVLAFNLEGMDAADVGTMLDVDHDIACRTGLHCAPRVHEQLGTDKIRGAVRFGIGPFNTKEHIQTAIEAVRDIASFKKH